MMRSVRFRLLLTLLASVGAAVSYAQWSNPSEDIPAYHNQAPPPGAKLPPILAGNQLTGEYFRYPWQVKVYREAARVPGVLYQLPCLCRCDKALGHTSLRSCFETTHGAACSTCAKEAFYAYKLTQQGKTARQIRDGVLRHEFESLNLDAQ